MNTPIENQLITVGNVPVPVPVLVIEYLGEREVPKSKDQILLLIMQLLAEQEERMQQIEAVQARHQERLNSIANRQDRMGGGTGHMTALVFCRLECLPSPLVFARRLDFLAADFCHRLGILTGQVPDERWGTVNSYPVEVLQECLLTMDQQDNAA